MAKLPVRRGDYSVICPLSSLVSCLPGGSHHHYSNSDMKVFNSVLETIGNTLSLPCTRSVMKIPALVLAKVETFNPGNSIKDRMALEDDPGSWIESSTDAGGPLWMHLRQYRNGTAIIYRWKDINAFLRLQISNLLKNKFAEGFGAEVIVCPTNVESHDPRSYYSVTKDCLKTTPNSFGAINMITLANSQAHFKVPVLKYGIRLMVRLRI